MESKFQAGDSVRIRRFTPVVDEEDVSVLTVESTLKTDHIGRRNNGDVFSYNESFLLGCLTAIEDVLTYGPEAAPEKGDPRWSYAVEHAVATYIVARYGLKEALADRIPFGQTLVIFACGASVVAVTGEYVPPQCTNQACDRCYPENPRWGVLAGMRVDGKMGIEKLLADE